jgi:hypothetical protein
MIPEKMRNFIRIADKQARKEEHLCLVPGCQRKAIQSHAIPRSLIIKAIAENGLVYSQNPSFTSMIRMESMDHPQEVVEVGVNKASTFSGFCNKHDSILFASIETKSEDLKVSAVFALHLRSLSLEYSRKRLVSSFQQKLNELLLRNGETGPPESPFPAIRDYLKFVLDSMFLEKERLGAINYISIPIGRNIELSCCGVFDHFFEDGRHFISYNIISYEEFSFVTLTVFYNGNSLIDSFLAKFGYPENFQLENLINDIAFSKGEEPLISPRLWRSLSEDEKQAIRLSLRPPFVRTSLDAPRIIKLRPTDTGMPPTEQMWLTFVRNLARGTSKSMEKGAP